jgi:exodeoxyribonuclease V alpha subunit
MHVDRVTAAAHNLALLS